jgi:catechol 2,3-dioxygenase-like lactoylglutathione lyase family enzyme
MIDHLEIQTRDRDKTAQFYADVLAPLGYERKMDARAIGFGAGTRLDFFIVDGSPSRDVHYAFEAPARAIVDSIYRLGAEKGHKLDRAPTLAPQVHPNYYAGYLRDPDDRLIEFVCHAAE